MRYYTSFFFCFILWCTYSQEPAYFHLTEKNKLPDVEFYDILEDDEDFIWLAADKGLFRFNGKLYENFSHPQKQGLSVFNLKKDFKQRVWCNNISGQFFFFENNKLHLFIDIQYLLKGELATFFVTEESLIVISLRNVYSINLKNKKIRTILQDKFGLSNPYIDNDFSFIIQKNNIFIINKENNISHLKLKDYKKKNTIHEGRAILFKYQDKYYFYQIIENKSAFYEIDIKQKTITPVDQLSFLKNKQIYKIIEIGSDLWIATNHGVFIVNIEKEKFILKKRLLPKEKISSILKDKDANYWLGTLNNGIFIIPNIEVINYKLPEELLGISCATKISDNQLIFGTKKGYIAIYDFTRNKIVFNKKLGVNITALQFNKKTNSTFIATELTSFILHNSNKKLIENKLFKLTKSFSRLNEYQTLYCTYDRVLIYDERTKKTSFFSNGKRAYTTFFNDKDSLKYIAYIDDLYAFKEDKEHNITNKNQKILATQITQTKDSTIWVSTFKNGFFAIKNNNLEKQYTLKDGLISNQINFIKAIDNNLWVASSRGLQKIDVVKNNIQTIYEEDGILHHKINSIHNFRDKIVCTSNTGLFSFNSSNVFKKKSLSKVHFKTIKVNNKEISNFTKNEFDYNENAISFTFNTNGFSYQFNDKYNYRLLGFDDNWTETNSNQNSVNYNSLPAGNYEFQVKNKLPNSMLKSFSFSIKLPFWKTWWFIGLFVIGFFAFSIFFLVKKNNREKKKRIYQINQLALDNELVNLKLENLRSQMNPHFVFNALNSIQEYIISNEKKLAVKFLVHFSRLIRMYLDHSRKDVISLNQEIEALEYYLMLEKNRFEENMIYEIIVDPSLNIKSLIVPSLFIQPYVENAIKHGLLHKKGIKKLKVSFQKDSVKNLLICIIEDNGVGRAYTREINKKKEYQSFSLDANKNRVALMNKNSKINIQVKIEDLFSYNNKLPIGTKVIINLPLKLTL